MLKTWRNNFEFGGEEVVTILSHRPVTRSDLKQDRLFFCESVSTFLQLVVELVWKGVYKPMSLSFLACEQAPLFGRAKRAFSRGRVYFSRYPQMENLLVASYRFWMLFRLIYRRGGDSWSAAIQSQSKRKISCATEVNFTNTLFELKKVFQS